MSTAQPLDDIDCPVIIGKNSSGFTVGREEFLHVWNKIMSDA